MKWIPVVQFDSVSVHVRRVRVWTALSCVCVCVSWGFKLSHSHVRSHTAFTRCLSLCRFTLLTQFRATDCCINDMFCQVGVLVKCFLDEFTQWWNVFRHVDLNLLKSVFPSVFDYEAEGMWFDVFSANDDLDIGVFWHLLLCFTEERNECGYGTSQCE